MTTTCGHLGNRRLIHAGGLIDAAGTAFSPGALLLDDQQVCAWGHPEDIGPVEDAAFESHPKSVLLPGLVNAHAHLDLSGPGPWPAAGDDFRGWVGQVRSLRASQDSGDRKRACERGIQLALNGGTACVGDIAGGPPEEAIQALVESCLHGVSYIEIFGIGSGTAYGITQIERAHAAWPSHQGGVAIGLSPHAPYSCDHAVYEAACATGRPVATHLVETPAEIELLCHGTGPIREMLEDDIGVWDAEVSVPRKHPVDHLMSVLERSPMLAAHLHWLESRHIPLLAKTHMSGVYCPRAAKAFGHAPPNLPVHPWRALREAGVNIALGTDALLCLDTPDRISILDEMRLLWQRDEVDAMTLLQMGTVAGAEVLGLDSKLVTFHSNMAGIISVPGGGDRALLQLEDALSRQEPPVWVLEPHGKMT